MKKKIISLMIIILIISTLIITNNNSKKEITTTNKILEKKNKSKSKSKNKNSNILDFEKFQELIKEKKVYTFAIIDNNSNISIKFNELINTMSTIHNEKIYILYINTLSKKERAKYFNINKELSTLESNFIIKTYANKIISTTTFDKNNIDLIINYYKKE